MSLALGLTADGYAAKKKKSPRPGKRKGPGAHVVRSQLRPKDPWVQKLRETIPEASCLDAPDAKALRGLGGKYSRITQVNQAGAGSGIVDALQKVKAIHGEEMALILGYADTFARALLRRADVAMPVPHGNLVKVGAQGHFEIDPAAMAVLRTEGFGIPGGVSPSRVALEELAHRYGMARFYQEATDHFCRTMAEMDQGYGTIGREMRAWKSEADAARRQSPIDPTKVESLSQTADDLVERARDLVVRTPSRVLSYNADDPHTKILGQADFIAAGGDAAANGYLETVPQYEGELVRQAMEQACVVHRNGLAEKVLSIQGSVHNLREWAGLTNRHYILHGSQVEQDMKLPSVVPLLRRRLGDLQQNEGDHNRGRYRKQSALTFAQRLVAHMLHEIARKRPEDAKEIVARARAMVEGSNGAEDLSPDQTIGDVLRDQAKIIAALGLDASEPLHLPNKQNLYGIQAEHYSTLHELLAWRGLEILENLARGNYDQADLGWAFSLSDAGQLNGQLTKIPRAWDTTQMLANQAAGVSTQRDFGRKFHGDSPLKDGGRTVASAAQVATLQLLLEQFRDSLPRKQRLLVPKAVGMKKRSWTKESGIAVTAVLGLPEPPEGTLSQAADADREQDCHPDALQVLKQGRLYHARIVELLDELGSAPKPFPWLEPFLPHFTEGGLRVAFSPHSGRIVLEASSPGLQN